VTSSVLAITVNTLAASVLLLQAGSGAPVARPAAKVAARPLSVRPASQISEARRLADLVNRHRVSIGLAPLSWSSRAERVAMAHSQDMVRRRFFSHVNPDRKSPFDRMRAAGLVFRAAGENIASGQTTADEAFESWIRSRGHRANIESPLFTHQGIAVYRNHWTQVLLKPR
jgi:uncharacterized protein YkwD